MNAANAAISLAQGLVYHDGGLVEHLVQSLGGDEGLGVHLVDVLGAGGAGGEPVVLGGDLQTADLGVVARCLGQLGGDVFASRVEAVTSSPDSAANLAFCSSVVGVSTRLYQDSPKRSTCSW